MTRIIFPDPLEWSAGIEFGLQAVGRAFHADAVSCYFNSEGPMLEAIAYAAKEMLLSNVYFEEKKALFRIEADLFLYPRVCPMEVEEIHRLVGSGETVITSDPVIKRSAPSLRLFMRRNVSELTGLLDV